MSGQEGPETVSYWAKILVEQGVQVAMSTLGELPEYNVSVAEAAMQAAYEGKSKDFANYIDARWHEQIDLTKLENDSSWIKRETLLFLRGGDEFWLSLLFSNNGHATHYPLNACLEEIEYNLRAGQDIPFERVDRFLDIAIKHGMRANEIKEQGMELPFSLACGILAQLHGHPPENVARWKKVIERIDQRNNQTDYFDQIEGELKVLLSNTPINTLAIQKVAETVSQIPYKDRRLSPYSYVVDQAEDRALYPAVQFMSALSAGGLDVSHYEPDGITPLHATLRSERLNASDLREIA